MSGLQTALKSARDSNTASSANNPAVEDMRDVKTALKNVKGTKVTNAAPMTNEVAFKALFSFKKSFFGLGRNLLGLDFQHLFTSFVINSDVTKNKNTNTR